MEKRERERKLYKATRRIEEEEEESEEEEDEEEEDGEIRCICGKNVDHGLMIQCDKCSVWQHGACFNLKGKDNIPDIWLCEQCDKSKQPQESHSFDFIGDKALIAQFEVIKLIEKNS